MLSHYKYTDKEKDALVKSMTILIDTREQKNEHLTQYWDDKKVPYKSRALSYGDYSFMIPANDDLNIPRDLYFDKDIVVERKGSLEELSGNFTTDRDRIEKEMTLAPHRKILLIENANYNDVVMSHYQTQYNWKSFSGTIMSFWMKYDIPPIFMPDKRFSGLFIKQYFEYYLKHILR